MIHFSIASHLINTMDKSKYILAMMNKILSMAIAQSEYYHVFTNNKGEEVEFFLLQKANVHFIRANMKNQQGYNQWFQTDNYKDFLNYFYIDESRLVSYLNHHLETSYVYFLDEAKEIESLIGSKKCKEAMDAHKLFYQNLSKVIDSQFKKSAFLKIVKE